MNAQQKPLLLIAALFAIPILSAMLFNTYPEFLGSITTKNYGKLIQPPRPIANLELTGANNNKIVQQDLEGRWTFVIITNKSCDTNCRERLHKVRQTRKALGRHSDEIRYLLLELHPNVSSHDELKTDPDLLIASPRQSQAWTQLFSNVGDMTTNIYLIDPLGNLMMRFPPQLEGRLILKDMQRLVNVSWIQPK